MVGIRAWRPGPSGGRTGGPRLTGSGLSGSVFLNHRPRRFPVCCRGAITGDPNSSGGGPGGRSGWITVCAGSNRWNWVDAGSGGAVGHSDGGGNWGETIGCCTRRTSPDGRGCGCGCCGCGCWGGGPGGRDLGARTGGAGLAGISAACTSCVIRANISIDMPRG